MSRRRAEPPDSLELLLDTICNTFGGVLFMAILIAMLIQTSGKRPTSADRPPPTQVVEARRMNDALEDAIERRRLLLESIERQQRFIAEFTTDEVQAGLADLQAIDSRKSEILKAAAEQSSSLAEMEAEIERLRQEIQQLDAQLGEAQRRRESVRSEVKQETAKRTQTIRLPRLRPSGKNEIGMICRFGRLYVWHEYDASGNRRGINLSDMVVLENGARGVEVAPKPYAGAAVSDRAQVERRLRPFNPRFNYIAIIVYKDSFKSFGDLKKVLIDNGFEYRLMPTDVGIVIRDSGGVGGAVQ